MNNVGISYLLWGLWFFTGLAGLHRIYNKKYASGFLWLFTFGLFGIGQLIDLIFIPDMVAEHNARQLRKLGMSSSGFPLDTSPSVQQVVSTKAPDPPKAEPPTREQKMIQILRAAQARSGKITVTQAVLDTELSFSDVEETLKHMMRTGYVEATNDPNTGIVVYDFLEL